MARVANKRAQWDERSRHTYVVTSKRPESHCAVDWGRRDQMMVFDERHARYVLYMCPPSVHRYNS